MLTSKRPEASAYSIGWHARVQAQRRCGDYLQKPLPAFIAMVPRKIKPKHKYQFGRQPSFARTHSFQET